MGAEIIHAKEDFTTATVKFIRTHLEQTVARQGYFVMSLCGGNTPRPVYQALGKSSRNLPWNKVILTFGDERCVPPDHEDSNFRMVKETLLDRVEIPETNVLRMKGDLDPGEAARDYEEQLQATARTWGMEEFRHDLVLLGIGGDGHTASLFPGSAALEIKDRAVIDNYVEKFDAWRITLTYPTINQSAAVAFLVGGEDKKPVVDEILSGQSNHPAARIQPGSGDLFFFLGY